MDETGYHDEAEGWDPAGNWCGERYWCGERLRATYQDYIVWLLKKFNGVHISPLTPYEKAIVERYKAEQEYHRRCREENVKKGEEDA